MRSPLGRKQHQAIEVASKPPVWIACLNADISSHQATFVPSPFHYERLKKIFYKHTKKKPSPDPLVLAVIEEPDTFICRPSMPGENGGLHGVARIEAIVLCDANDSVTDAGKTLTWIVMEKCVRFICISTNTLQLYLLHILLHNVSGISAVNRN